MAAPRTQVALRLFLMLLVGALPGLASAQGGAGPAYRVVLLGDSITAGEMSGPIGSPYADVVAQQLGPDYEVVNIGCGGATSADWLPNSDWPLCYTPTNPRMLPNFFSGLALPNLPADFVTILLGTNDAVGFFEPAPIESAAYRANLDVLVDALLLAGARTVLLMSPPPNPGHPADPIDVRLQGYRGELADLCISNPDVLCGPDLYNLLDDSDFTDAAIHPNATGHSKIALELTTDLLIHTPVEARADLLAPSQPFFSLAGMSILPIVVYSTADFDAVAEIDRASFSFGARGDEDSLLLLPNAGQPACLPADVDGDGASDLVCAFDAKRTGLTYDAIEARLLGRLYDGTALSAHVTRAASTPIGRTGFGWDTFSADWSNSSFSEAIR